VQIEWIVELVWLELELMDLSYLAIRFVFELVIQLVFEFVIQLLIEVGIGTDFVEWESR